MFNSLAPGRLEWNFRWVIFKLILVVDGWVIFCEIAVRWMSLDLTDDQSTLVQVMAWCHQATSHSLSQCWHRSMLPYGVTGPQWVKALWLACYWVMEVGHHWSRFLNNADVYHLEPLEQTAVKIEATNKTFPATKCFWKCWEKYHSFCSRGLNKMPTPGEHYFEILSSL